jgi:predicted transporter
MFMFLESFVFSVIRITSHPCKAVGSLVFFLGLLVVLAEKLMLWFCKILTVKSVLIRVSETGFVFEFFFNRDEKTNKT